MLCMAGACTAFVRAPLLEQCVHDGWHRQRSNNKLLDACSSHGQNSLGESSSENIQFCVVWSTPTTHCLVKRQSGQLSGRTVMPCLNISLGLQVRWLQGNGHSEIGLLSCVAMLASCARRNQCMQQYKHTQW